MVNANDVDYPTTIIRTRYGGVYEGGRWAALDCSHEEVPEDAISEDVPCFEFWSLAHGREFPISDWRGWVETPGSTFGEQPSRILIVGVGETPDAALEALRERRRSRGDKTAAPSDSAG